MDTLKNRDLLVCPSAVAPDQSILLLTGMTLGGHKLVLHAVVKQSVSRNFPA